MILNSNTMRASEAPPELPHGFYLQQGLLLSCVVEGKAFTLQMTSVEALQMGAAMIHAAIEAAKVEEALAMPTAGSA
jgi:hypothetical protein